MQPRRCSYIHSGTPGLGGGVLLLFRWGGFAKGLPFWNPYTSKGALKRTLKMDWFCLRRAVTSKAVKVVGLIKSVLARAWGEDTVYLQDHTPRLCKDT